MKPNNASSMAITKSTFFAILLIALPIGLCAQTDDTTPPELIEFGFIPKSIDVGAGPLDVTVTFRITDDLSGVHAAGVVFDSPSGQQSRGLSISVSNLISGDENDGVFQGTITFPELSETGIWHIQGGVFSVDSVGNIRQYSDAEITAMGFPTELEVVSEPTIEGILFFFEEAVAAGTIYGRGKIPSLDNFRLMLFRQMLETAGWFIEKDKTNAVCRTLDRAYLRCDGEPWPKDFVVGDAVPELAQMVEGLMEYLECD